MKTQLGLYCRLLVLIFCGWIASGQRVDAANIELSGSCSWSISGNSIDIEAGRVENLSSSGTSGTLRLRIWATASPYSGGTINGYVLGTRSLGTLQAGYYYSNISGSVTYSAPPPGTYYTTLTVEEYTGSGYTIRDYLTFSGSDVFGGGSSSDVVLEGNGSWSISGSSINIGVTRVSNDGGGTSGSLRLQIWATSSPYSGSAMSGYVIGTRNLNPLSGNHYYSNVSGNVSYIPPPYGTYYTALTLEEYVSGSYQIVDYITFSGTSVLGSGGTSGVSDVELDGIIGWRVSGKTITIEAGAVVNSGGGTSGTLRLQTWATASPYSGGTINGYILGTYRMNPLRAGYQYTNVRGNAKYYSPPSGVYYTTVTLEEYTSSGFVIVDYLTFSSTSSFSSGSYGGFGGDGAGTGAGLHLEGTVSYKIAKTRATLTSAKVVNNRSSGTSGTLRLRLWLTSEPYNGSSIFGYPVATRPLGILSSGYYYYNITGAVDYFKPPRGIYYVTMTLEEFNGSGYEIVDYVNFTKLFKVK
jgi:hypothetical protein